jgi:hypothetical protein
MENSVFWDVTPNRRFGGMYRLHHQGDKNQRAKNWPILPAPDDVRLWLIRWNNNWQEKPKYSEKSCPSATLFTINPT